MLVNVIYCNTICFNFNKIAIFETVFKKEDGIKQ